jgi:hypothetical protein
MLVANMGERFAANMGERFAANMGEGYIEWGREVW